MKQAAIHTLTMALVLFLSITINAQQIGVQQQITPDGKTNTKVSVTGTTTNITTTTVHGTEGFNSFTTFNVAQGNTVNLIFPSGSLNLLNLVNSQAINIFGILNSVQNSKIAGNVLFADPFGIVVGKTGSINVGSLTVVTPTKAFMDSFFSSPGEPSEARAAALLSGDVPISPDGTVLVQGKVNAASDITLLGENVNNAGVIASGAVFAGSQPDFSDVVNMNGLTPGTALSSQNGDIEIVAQGDFQNSGVIATNGANNLRAGNLSIQAGGDVTLQAGTLITASGMGQNSSAGQVKILAGHNSEFDSGALIAASGGNVSGNGGAVELSAKDVVTLAGGTFDAGAAHGRAGSVLIDPTTTDITANVSTGGADYTNSGDTLLVEPGVTIDTENASGNSGSITLNATSMMNIGNCATPPCSATTLDASNTSGFSAGNVTLAASNTVNKTWDPNNPDGNFNTDQASATIIVGPNAVIKGQDVSVTATATTSKTATISETADGSETQAPDALCVIFGGGGSCGSNTSPVSVTDNLLNLVGVGNFAGGVVSKATANIQVQGGAQISAGGKVTIDSEASSTTNFTANGLYITYGESDASATAQVQSGAMIASAGDFNLTAHSVNNLTTTGKAVAGQSNNGNSVTQSGPAVVFTYSEGNSTSVAGVESGATVDADNVNVLAKNENSFQTKATPSVNGDSGSSQQYGAGVAIAISNTSSSTDAHLDGTIVATGAISSDAESLNKKDQISSAAVVKNGTTSGDKNSTNTNNAKNNTSSAANNNSSGNPDGRSQTSGLDLGAAVAIVSSTNTASSTAGPGASLTSGAGKDVTLKANASDKIKTDASGTADSATASIGGAVAVSNYTNSATASIGQNALVDAGGKLDVKATAELPDDLAGLLEGIETYLENFSISGATNDLNNVVSQVRSGFGGAKSVFDSIKGAYDSLTDGTTSSLSSTAQPSGGGVGVAGAVDILTANNTATAFIDQGATVNAQAATVEATAKTESANAVGTSDAQKSSDSVQNSTGTTSSNSSPLGAFGGSYSGITYNNAATSYIADGATVNTPGGDVNVTSTATNFMANKFAAGADAGNGNIALSGAISNVTLNSNSTAYIDDQAVVNAAGNVKVDAENSTQAYQIGDDTDSASTLAVGVALGFLNISNTTNSFIGDNGTASGYPTGHVDATGNVNVMANSKERLMAAAASSVQTSNGTTNSGGPASCNPNCGASSGQNNGTNNTADSNPTASTGSYNNGGNYGFGISGDIAFNNINDTTKGYISDGVTVNSASTSVSAADKSLMLAADGGLVRASTAGLQAAFADNTISKTTEAYTQGAILDTGSLDVNANSSDLVLAATAGGAGTSGENAITNIAGSLDLNHIGNTTTASVDGTTVRGQSGGSSPAGAVNVSANNGETVFSVAGSFAYGSSDLGIGVGLDVGNINNAVTATVDSASNIQSNSTVGVTAADNENQLSVAADLAVISGGSSNAVAVSIADETVNKNVQAAVNGAVNAAGTVTVQANDDQGGTSLGLPTGLIAIAGAVPVSGGGGDTGLGAAATISNTDKTVQASIGNGAEVTATGGDVEVIAQTLDNLDLFAGGGAYGAEAGFMGSAVVDLLTNDTSANLGAATVSGQNVNVKASDTLNIIGGAGGFSGSNTAAIGAGGDLECLGTGTAACALFGNTPLTVSASIAPNATVSATNGNVDVAANETPTLTSVAADAGFSSDATVIGSGTVLNFNTLTEANSNGDVNATGTLSVTADREDNLTTVAGQAAIGGTAGIGISVSFVDKNDSVYAYLGGGTENVGGLQVAATGNDTSNTLAVGGAVSESVAVGVSGVVNFLDETTDAYIGEATPTAGSIPTVNPIATGPVVNAGSGGVDVTSTSDTNFSKSVAGQLAIGIDVGVAVAADVASITKNTYAEVYKGADVNSTGDVLVGANADESSASFAASAAGGYVGVGPSTSVYLINDTTQSSVDGGATLVANDSVGVSSTDVTDLDILDADGAGGFVGVGAALAFADVTKHTNALVKGSVTAKGQGTPLSANNGTFSISYPSFLSGFGSSFSSNVTGNLTNSSLPAPSVPVNQTPNLLNDPMLTGERLATPNTTPLNGLAVTATSTNDFNMLAAGGAGGFVGVTANGSIFLLNNNTKAEIGSGATIGAGTDSVLVAAGSDVGHVGSALGVAGGFVGVGPGFDISILGNNTTADITGATVNANGNVAVNADASEDVLSLVVGASGGAVGVSASFSLDQLTDNTTAGIGGTSTVNAGGNLQVNSNDATDTDALVGSLGGGFFAGAGNAVAIALVNKTTTASLGDGSNPLNTTVGGSTSVNAGSSEEISDGTVAGGGAVFGATAGAVSFESDSSTTSATVGQGADSAGAGLSVAAGNAASVYSFDGTGSIALAGDISGSVDVGNIENPTTAAINGANVTTTGGDVDVSANETRNINSTAASLGLSGAPIDASVIDWGVSAGINNNIGKASFPGSPANMDPLASGNYNNSGSNTANNTGYVDQEADTQLGCAVSGGCASAQQSNATGLLGYAGAGAAGSQTAATNDLNSGTSGNPVTNAVALAPTVGTTAVINGGAVNSAGAVKVNSADTTNLNMTAGGASAGGAALGAAVDLASVDTSSTAEIIGGSQISAAGNVIVNGDRMETLSGQALSGNGGLLFGAGGAVTVLSDDQGSTDAELDATIAQSCCLQITALTTRTEGASSGQASLSFGVAAGYAYSSVNEGGNTTAQIDSGSQTLPAVQGVTVTADDNSAAASSTHALDGGLLGSVGGSEADTYIDPTVDAHIASGTSIATAAPTQSNPQIGLVEVLASTEEDANSNVMGTGIGGINIGIGSTANATANPTVDAYINGTVNAGGDVTVAARYNFTSNNQPLFTCQPGVTGNGCANVQAQATASNGSLLGNAGNGVNTNATSTPTISAYFNGANVTSGGTVSIYSESGSSVFSSANASSGTFGVNLPGDTKATSTITNQNDSYVMNGTVNATNFQMSALSTDNASRGATANGSGGGFISGTGTEADANLNGNTQAQLQGSSSINAGKNVTINATVAEQDSATASDSEGGLGVTDNVVANVSNSDTPEVLMEQGSTINAATAPTTLGSCNCPGGAPGATLEADVTQALFSASATANVTAGAGNAQATANLNVTDNPLVQVLGNISSPPKLSLIAAVNTDPNAVNIKGYADGTLNGITGYRGEGTDDNNTEFGSQVVVGMGSTIVPTLTADNLDIEATVPLPASSGDNPPNSNPFWSNYANGTSNCLCLPGESNPEGSYTINPSITLNATIIEPPGTPDPVLTVDANGNITGNVTASKSEDDVIVPNLNDPTTASITLNTPGGTLSGDATVHDDTGWQTVTITNNSSYDLVLNSIQPLGDPNGMPTVTTVATNDTLNLNFTTDNTPPAVTIANTSPTAVTDIYLNGPIEAPTGSVSMSALLGSILQLPNGVTNQIEATDISLTASHGTLGDAVNPLNLTLVDVEGGPTAKLDALTEENFYANIGALENLHLGDPVPASLTMNLDSIEAGDIVALTFNPAIAVLPVAGSGTIIFCGVPVPVPTITNVPNTVTGIYNLTGDITAGGNVLLNLPGQTALNMPSGSKITSGFENINFTVNSNGTWSSTPIPVNYSDSIGAGNVAMEDFQQQGGNVTISGAGSLTGAGTINVLNGYSNVTITNKSSNDLTIGNMNFSTPVNGAVSIFGASQSLGGNYNGTSIALTETNNPTSTINVNQNGASGNLRLNGGILNPSGTTNLTAANGSILNTAMSASSQLVQSDFLNLNAPNGQIGSMGTPINTEVGAGNINAAAMGDVSLNQVAGDLNVDAITSSAGNIYITSYGSILNDAPGSAVNLTGNNINLTATNGSIGNSTHSLVVNNRNGVNTVSGTATGTPTGHSLDMVANGDIYVEERAGDLISSKQITSNTGNVNLKVTNGSAWINAINVAPYGNQLTSSLADANTMVTLLIMGNVLNVNSIFNPDTLTMTVLPSAGYHWTTTPGTDTIRVGNAGVFSTITATADIINMPNVYALNPSTDTNDLARQTNGLHFFVQGYGNPGGLNFVTNEANNITINVKPCPFGCTTIPAVVFNNLITDKATINVGEEWLETINTIIGTSAQLNTPYQQVGITNKQAPKLTSGRYTSFYLFLIGNKLVTNASSSYFGAKGNVINSSYILTQPLNTIVNDLTTYYGLPK